MRKIQSKNKSVCEEYRAVVRSLVMGLFLNFVYRTRITFPSMICLKEFDYPVKFCFEFLSEKKKLSQTNFIHVHTSEQKFEIEVGLKGGNSVN